MLKALLHIRLLQFIRIMKELGILRIIVLFVIVLLFAVYLNNAFSQNKKLSILACYICSATIHSLRKDKKFVAAVFEHPYLVYFTEYLVYTLPLLVLIVFATNLFYLILSLAGMFLISTVNMYHRKNSTASISLFSRLAKNENFEWIAGLRSAGLFVFLLWILALSLSFISYVSLVFAWIILLIFASFYEANEPLNMLVINEYGAKKFINNKLFSHMKNYFKVIAPIIILHGILNCELWLLTICFFTVNIFCFSVIILNKYATYKPAKYSGANIVIVMFILLSNLILPLLIFTVPFAIISYKQAINNLNFYLDDFD
jgi:hypothetical protein